MATRRASSVCWSCQSRQSLVGRRRLTFTRRTKLETVALRPEDDGFLLDGGKQEHEGCDGPVLPTSETARQWRLHSPVDELREALLGFDALYKRRDLRLEVLRSLSNPWPASRSGRQHRETQISKPELQLPEANAALVPHDIFRKRLQLAMSDKEIRKIIRIQLLRCEWPGEILRVMAVAMQHKVTAQNFAVLAEPIVRALYRCRINVSDPEVLKVINITYWRFKSAHLPFSLILIQMGLKFAARSRSLKAMKKYLQLLRSTEQAMTSNVFRSIIAKFSIGHRGLGEIRNGRWRRDELLQVLNGFHDEKDLPVEQQCHLGTFLDRDDWQYLHGWVAVLARCKESECVWREWQLWKRSPARTRPKKLESQGSGMTSRKRGDYWFVEQMAMSGDYEKAWSLVAETGVPFTSLKDRVKARLIEGIQYATQWDDDMRNEVLQKYDADLAKIEKALGVRWVATADGEGAHELIGEQEDSLEALSNAGRSLNDEDFGFPYDDEAIVHGVDERALHDAEEQELADGDGSG